MKKTNNSVLSQYRGALMGISIILIIVFHFTDDCHYCLLYTSIRYQSCRERTTTKKNKKVVDNDLQT